MTQEEKQLLLKDICARLPYGLKYNFGGNDGCDYTMDKINLTAVDDAFPIEDIKPYLRPLSSITEEEKIELNTITKGAIQTIGLEDIVVTTDEGFDWLNEHHFDYRGLINKGLALEMVVWNDEQCELALKMWNEPLSLK